MKNYADAKEWCENAAKNGFKVGRLFEPKTKSIIDKVYADSILINRHKNKMITKSGRKTTYGRQDWIGINAESGPWAYTSSTSKLEFQNWAPGKETKGRSSGQTPFTL